jgi:hypothetical protein
MIQAILALALACIALGFTSCSYRDRLIAMEQTLEAQSSAIKTQNEEAGALLAQRTAERDAKQAALDRLAADQEKKDEAARNEIARLGGELRNRPIRVRVIPERSPGGQGGGGAPGASAGTTAPGAGDTEPATWVLPEATARSLGEVITEVETLSAAYSSCRAVLLGR